MEGAKGMDAPREVIAWWVGSKGMGDDTARKRRRRRADGNREHFRMRMNRICSIEGQQIMRPVE